MSKNINIDEARKACLEYVDQAVHSASYGGHSSALVYISKAMDCIEGIDDELFFKCFMEKLNMCISFSTPDMMKHELKENFPKMVELYRENKIKIEDKDLALIADNVGVEEVNKILASDDLGKIYPNVDGENLSISCSPMIQKRRTISTL